jgi:uncharacterized protein (DUF3084 family)
MTYEEMRRMMEFILEQQAQLTAKQQRAEERADRADGRADRAAERAERAEERITRAEKLITRTARTVDRLATAMVERASALSEELDAKFAALVDSQMRTEEVVRRLSERGEKTDEAVRNLTGVVDRHLRDHENGERRQSRDEPAS